jgi:hypothetical protein
MERELAGSCNLFVAIVQLSPLPGATQARRERQAEPTSHVDPDAPSRITG